MDADAVGVTSGQESGARGGADGLRDMEVPEDRPLVRHAVDIRRLVPLGSELADVGIAHVVVEEDDDVRLP